MNSDISSVVVDAAYTVHQALGPGLLESCYEDCLCYELTKRNLPFEKQKLLPVIYDGFEVGNGFRIDLLVNDALIVEVKSVDTLLPVHQAQILTYLKLSGVKTGLLINFNSKMFKEGIRRFSL
ncbi:MAG: GxxExxY protein [Proteobacteria bacterium]|nr:GxxExxY protein [Pseudomonadota bacterium]